MDNFLAKTIEQRVEQHANNMPSKAAIICNGNTMTYSQLWSFVLQESQNLESNNGLRSGMLNFFRAKQDASFIIEYLATHLIGAVAVPLEKDFPAERLNSLKSKYGSTVLQQDYDDIENIADILFTTGSTGQQKGVMESYSAILADADNLINAQGFSSDMVFIICGPLNHIGSLSKIWPVLYLGGTLIIADGMKDIDALFRLFDYPSNHIATFMVPASIRMVLQFGKERIARVADKIEFIETGGAAISQSDMDELCSLLPKTRLYNTYASTETGIVCTYDYNHNPCIAGCTGRPMKNSSVSISTDGTIICKGKTLMSGYFNDESLTKNILHDNAVFTSDLGEIDSQGFLHIKGRNNDVINIGGYKVSPTEIENVANSFPSITESICIPYHSDIFGDTIKLLYVSTSGTNIMKRDIARYLSANLESYKQPHLFEQVESIKHTYNGKLDRKFYRQN